jgi:hypothetical protein
LLRLDFSATIPGKGCFFRGEEKKLDSNEDPREELTRKLLATWPFPGLPFVLGYFSIGAMVTFCAVFEDNAQPLDQLALDLNNPRARLMCWNAVRNVSRVIKFMATNFNSISPHDLQELKKDHSMGTDWSRTISFSGGHVLKKIFLRDGETEERLKRYHAIALTLGLPHCKRRSSFPWTPSTASRERCPQLPVDAVHSFPWTLSTNS